MKIGNRIAACRSIARSLGRVVEVISAVVESDSCFVYVLEGMSLSCGPPKIRIQKL